MSFQVKLLVVAGGGGGGEGGAGGGAGGYQYDAAHTITSNSIAVTVGNGGAGSTNSTVKGSNGEDSIFDGVTSVGGGGGASSGNQNGSNGGSGGGGIRNTSTAGTGTGSQGSAGGISSATNVSGCGGGGGSGAVGGTGATNTGANGGSGTLNSISGSSVAYAGGGGGGDEVGASGGSGGTGGGGAGGGTSANGVDGTANTGGGGGGGGTNGPGGNGGNGGSGVVIVSYVTGSLTATGGTITTSGGETIHTFTSSGTFLSNIFTSAVTDIDITTATGGGLIGSDGGATITERGVVWSTATTPTTANFKSAVSGTTGTFTAPMTGLIANTLYYVRAYFINSNGTSYGNEVTFTTESIAVNQVIKDIGGIEGETYAVSVYVGGTTGTVTVQLGTTGDSQVFTAGAGISTMQGEYSGLSGLIFTASGTFNGYIDDVMWVLVLGDATIDWDLDSLTNVFPINSSVVFKRVEDKDFARFRIYRYLDVQFKDLNAYVTVLLKKEANEDLSDNTKEFLVSNVSGETLPFIDKRISMLLKGQALRVGLSNDRLNETFTVCQFILKGTSEVRKLFDRSKIISV